MDGPQLLILQACTRVPSDEYGLVLDTDLARHTLLPLFDIRDYLACLEHEGFVSLLRLENPDAFKAHVEAKGRIELSKRQLLRDGPKEKHGGTNPIKVVPKGLRSFDQHDSEFFLELLPGPRRADGLPESVSFWKVRIEEVDPEKSFSIGIIFGPSGCGKSSLVKAGLLPHLSKSVIPVYTEATAGETEARLLRGLRKHVPDLPLDLGLQDSLTAVKQRAVGAKKLLLVIDQFEQWLHANWDEKGTELVSALTECDGELVQAILTVRDDFSTALHRFLEIVGVRIDQDRNYSFVDLFDRQHARKVLAAFGRGYGTLPDDSLAITDGQNEFLDRSIDGLSEEGRVVSVRLSLFAEMVKGKPWTPGTLKQIGGASGVGLTFLEETFGPRSAIPAHRIHQKAAQAVLKVLLPGSGSDIKGHMRSYRELLTASGYGSRPNEFDDLLRILDSELRLITPTDPEGATSEEQPARGRGERFFQLTHDYMVHSLHDWLTRKQRETRRGRAELRLVDRAALWNALPENRNLPSVWQWASIWILTSRQNWTETQRKMMRRVGRVYGVGTAASLAALAVFTLAGVLFYNTDRARAYVEKLSTAKIVDVPSIVEEISPYRRWASRPLSLLLSGRDKDTDDYLRACIAQVALWPDERKHVEALHERLLTASCEELRVVWSVLRTHDPKAVGRMRQILADPRSGPGPLFRAACALADCDDALRGEPLGIDVSDKVVNGFLAEVSKNPGGYLPLMKMLWPVRRHLLDSLAKAFKDTTLSEVEHSLATNILADFAGNQPTYLADRLIESVDSRSFDRLFDELDGRSDILVNHLEEKLDGPSVAAKTSDQPISDQQRARAAIALVRLNRPEKVWSLLVHSHDPCVRSYIISWLKTLGADPKPVAERLVSMGEEDASTPVKESQIDSILFHYEVSQRRALILALGGYDSSEISPGYLAHLVQLLIAAYCHHPDAGVHGAAEWALRCWKQEKELKRADEGLMKERWRGNRRWYVNKQGQAFAVISGPVSFRMGPPDEEPDHASPESLHPKRIDRRFALAMKEVTADQYERFAIENPEHRSNDIKQGDLDPRGPQVEVSWYDAVAYCNWLSGKEGLDESQWCYKRNSKGKYAEGISTVDDFLSLPGYRLPTEAEWEYACRAGSVTSRYFGSSVELLGNYAWLLSNSHDRVQVCGSLRPNDLGLFDMLGNVFEWCQDEYGANAPGEDKAVRSDSQKGSMTSEKIRRGGSFANQQEVIQSAYRNKRPPSYRSSLNGFRPARTCLDPL